MERLHLLIARQIRVLAKELHVKGLTTRERATQLATWQVEAERNRQQSACMERRKATTLRRKARWRAFEVAKASSEALEAAEALARLARLSDDEATAKAARRVKVLLGRVKRKALAA